ncbi:thiamine-phosphate kinase [Comamonas flocculans]|uniref:Thiamine-monophosphate kinase n=1 Tax=Comamonas flocculans TaxID=2597701 RepID=A0A5B8RUE5_9BURK|nr:thiamine-phosphate kinase [Comamonas flocculans]QEA13110.1 thiamine-phosphate kinase [Comamonas flocculans]
MGEFELIHRHFTRPVRRAALGVGDDCALLSPAPGMQLAISSDMLLEGRHFLPGTDPERLGHKALAVNLSDLAACGARPLAFTLALALPQAHEAWLAAFARGLFALADAHGCELIGGDTTRGPLNICITVFGELPRGDALLRSGARAGDDLWVSGAPGQARLALGALRGEWPLPSAVLAAVRARLERPTPRVALGLELRGLATSAIDVSDGLLGDLVHVLNASQVGATIAADKTSHLIAANTCQQSPDAVFELKTLALSEAQRQRCVLAGGDDYELVFTTPPARLDAVHAAGARSRTRVTRIGRIDAAPGLRLVDGGGQPLQGDFASFDHFA